MITNKDICIIIPIYKDNINNLLSNDEIESINHTIKIMYNYDIYFLCNENLDITFYKKFSNVKYKFFNFKTKEQYSNMCLNYKFYKMFLDYKYMLICQPDAYIFKDTLIEWCNKEYDYYGSLILFYDNYDAILTDDVDNINAYTIKAFNGGFSLRNINSFYNVCYKNKEQLINETMNEDLYICWHLNDHLKIITPKDAIKFGAETLVHSIYPKLYNELPFGCHTIKTRNTLYEIFNSI